MGAASPLSARRWRCSKRGAGVTRTVDVSSSERALCLTRLGTLRILARGDRKAARLDRCITQWLEIDVFFTRLPLLHIIERFPSGDHDALGRVAHKAGDLVVTHDETAAVVFDGPEHLGHKFVSVLALGRELLRGILFRELRRRIARSRLVRPWWQRARKIISEGGFSGLFAALKRGVALPAAAFAPLVELLQQEENRSAE